MFTPSKELVFSIKENHNFFKETEDIKSRLLYQSENLPSNPFLTYFIPTFNRINTLKEAINSILNQENCFEYEILIIDDSTITDNSNPTYNFILENKFPNIRYYVNEKNLGQAHNWNRGFTLANSNYVAMIHDDDLLCPDYSVKINKILKNIESKNINFGLVMPTGILYFEKKGLPEYSPGTTAKIIPERNINMYFRGLGLSICPSFGTLFNKNAVLDVGGFNYKLFPSFDYIISYQLLNSKYKCFSSNDLNGFYRISINEMLKKENLIKAFQFDYYFRELLYSRNIFTKLFGFLFRKVQYNYKILDYLSYAVNGNVSITVEELDFLNIYNYSKIRQLPFKICRKIVKIITQNKYMY